MMLLLARCSVCLLEKESSYFFKDKRKKNGLTSRCKDCFLTYYKKNKEKINKRSKTYYQNNRSEILLKLKEKNSLESEKIKKQKYNKKYLSTENGKIANRKKDHVRRSIIKNNNFLIYKKEIKKLLNSSCYLCGSKQNLTIDHIVPLSRGGQHRIGNLQCLCNSCNLYKGTKFLIEWKNINLFSAAKESDENETVFDNNTHCDFRNIFNERKCQ